MTPSQSLASNPALVSFAAEIMTDEVEFTNLVSRNITIAGHRTSVRLEPDMWTALKEISRRERANMHEVCTTVAQHKRVGSSLTAAIRVFIMAYFRAAATDDGQSAGRAWQWGSQWGQCYGAATSGHASSATAEVSRAAASNQ